MTPTFYDFKNVGVSSVTPNDLHVANTNIFVFFQTIFLKKAMSVFEVKNMPKHWDKDYFLYVLWEIGFLAVINTDRFGVIPQQCGLWGYNVFYRPSHATVQNPLIHAEHELVIGVDCEVIKLQPDYRSIMDIVNFYAGLSSLACETFAQNLFNSKLGYIFFSTNKAMAETFKKMYDKIASGEPIVVTDRSLLDPATGNPSWQAFSANLKDNFISKELLEILATIENMFDTEVGIPAANTEKRERMISAEIKVGSVETYSRMDFILDTLNDCCEKVNQMFGLNLKFDWRYPPELTGMGDVADADKSNFKRVGTL